MSGFERALRAMSREEMCECARELMACLTGRIGKGETRAELVSGAAENRAGHEWGAYAREEIQRSERGTKAARTAERGGNIRDAGHGGDGSELTERTRIPEGAVQTPEVVRARYGRRFEVYGDRRYRGGGGTDIETGAAVFQGPERRYENAVGARGSEMSRVSDYFRRDSRRYDAGFTRY